MVCDRMNARTTVSLGINSAQASSLGAGAAAHVLSRSLLTLMLICIASACSATQRDDFLSAREAFRVGDAVRLERSARSLSGYALEPYVAYWRLKLRLENASADEVQALLVRLRNTPLADSLRGNWLKLLATRQQWDAVDAEYAKYTGEDAESRCYSLQSRLRAGAADMLAAARELWLTGRELPESCTPVFDSLTASGVLTADEIWARVRLALEAGNTSVARRVSEYLPAAERLDARVAAIAVNPQAYLERRPYALASRADRETLMFAVHRLARTTPLPAAQQWANLAERFSESERGYVWGLIAYLGAQRLDPNALAWYARAGELSDAQLAWKVRAALRAQDWSAVLAAINAMSAKELQQPAWRYWKARALKAKGETQQASVLLAPLALEFNFYGLLAADELGAAATAPATSYTPGATEVRAIGATPGIERALEFYALNLRTEGNREWIWAIRDFDDRQLLAAAEFARRNELYDRAINTADKTVQLHDFSLRYLAPYREVMKNYVAQTSLDEAWVYGLIRQETRFLQAAKSSAGASGLMQLMPATARWVAGKIGLKNFNGAQTVKVETNLNLGTWYLKYVLDALDGQAVLASAAYNAGPGRARGWRAEIPMEGAIYAESIPFNETRDYVKKVMSNATYYAQQFGRTVRSLKDRVGIIAPRGRAGDKPLEEPAS